MVSKVDIANMALSEIGVEHISDIDETTKQAKQIKLFYDYVRDGVLRAFPWTFSLKQWVCAPLSSFDQWSDYPYAFAKPSDCLRFLRPVNQSEAVECVGKSIYSYDSSLRFIGICRVENEGDFDPMFVEVFALKLAIKLSIALSDDKGLRDRLIKDYDALVRKSEIKSAMEGPDNFYDFRSSWLEAHQQ